MFENALQIKNASATSQRRSLSVPFTAQFIAGSFRYTQLNA